MGGLLHTYPSFYVYLILFCCPLSTSLNTSCKLLRKFHLNEMHKPGDVILGGLFEVHYTSVFPERTFTSEPQQPSCKG